MASNDCTQWQRDFPTDAGAETDVARRDLVKFLLLISGAFTVGQYWIVLQASRPRTTSFPRVEIAKTDALPVNQALGFTYPTENDPCLLVRVGEAEFVAYDRRCTHLTCPVIAQAEAGRLFCPCHEGAFALATGAPISGPPQRPLKRIVLEVANDAVYAVGVENRTV